MKLFLMGPVFNEINLTFLLTTLTLCMIGKSHSHHISLPHILSISVVLLNLGVLCMTDI